VQGLSGVRQNDETNGYQSNNLPKNMPNMNGMDMSALEDMMGGAGMPDMSQLMG
jgi:signal recognition particle subunit SRP54